MLVAPRERRPSPRLLCLDAIVLVDLADEDLEQPGRVAVAPPAKPLVFERVEEAACVWGGLGGNGGEHGALTTNGLLRTVPQSCLCE